MPRVYPARIKKTVTIKNSCYTSFEENNEDELNEPLILHENELKILIQEEEVDEKKNDLEIDKGKIYKSEFKILSEYSIPIIFSEILRNTLLMTSVLFIGHRTTFELAAITLGKPEN